MWYFERRIEIFCRKMHITSMTLTVNCSSSQAPSTLIRFQTKTELFCSGYGYRPHYNAESDHRKRSHSKTLSRGERFENDAFWKRCFLVWTVRTMLSENGDVIQIDTTGANSTPARRATPPWVVYMHGKMRPRLTGLPYLTDPPRRVTPLIM